MRAGVIFFVFARMLLAQTTPPPEPKGTIRGIVRDTAGAPLVGVDVTATPVAVGAIVVADGTAIVMQHPVAAHSDETGSYALTGLVAGSYTVTPECEPSSKRLKLDADQEVALDFACPTNPTISGKVRDRNGDPAVDAFVWLLKSEYEAGVLRQIVIGPRVTVEDGSYTFDTGLEPNRSYYVIVDRDIPGELLTAAAADLDVRDPIEVPTYYPSATRLEAAAPVILQPGENRAQVDIKIASAAFHCVAGKISVSGAAASVNFSVQDIALAGTRLVRLRGESARDGKYRFCGLPAGVYRLSTQDAFNEFAVAGTDLEHADLSADSVQLRLRLEWDASTPPQLDASGDAILKAFALLLGLGDSPTAEELGQVADRLRSVNDEELTDLAVRLAETHKFTNEQTRSFWLQLTRGSIVGVVLTGATNGLSAYLAAPIPSEAAFRSGLSAGDYLVEVRPYGSPFGYAKEIDYNGTKITDDTVRVAPRAEGTVRIVMARDQSAIAVHAIDSDGNPAPNAAIVVVPDSVTSVALLSRSAIHGQTDQRGDFTPPPLAPGKYRVLAVTQTIRWGVPDDLQKVFLVLFQAKDVELDGKSTLQVALTPIAIY